MSNMSEIIGLIELSEEEAKERREFYRESSKDEDGLKEAIENYLKKKT